MSDAHRIHARARIAGAAIAIAAATLLTASTGASPARAEERIKVEPAEVRLPVSPTAPALSMEERLRAQRAIEEVYWRHRNWPKENRTPKPLLSAVVSDEAIRAKVEDYLKKSNALETWWQRPVTAAQLQAELDRMSKGTRDPEMLRELYAALGNDARLIAETLARPTLVDRLIHNWYANDERFHGAVKRQAEQALAAAPSVAELRTLGGEYSERTLMRREVATTQPGERHEPGVVERDAAEWTKWRADTARRLGSAEDAIPIGQLSALQEEGDRFFVTAVSSLDADQAVVTTVAWPKRTFDAWWSEQRPGMRAEVGAEAVSYSVRAPADGGCVDDTWQGGEFSSAPTARSGHTAVWTGAEMIVWGGQVWRWCNETTGECSPYLSNTGGRYDPSTDSWTTTTLGANVPSPRYQHTAVWTGTEMIVWGGFDQHGFTWRHANTGGRYNPSTDSWQPTSTGANVPSPRYQHTALWTGTEMIVWGGGNWEVAFNTGGRYNPLTDSWTPTSTGANVPSARGGLTAVWTGTEMIVWGGGSNTGGRYNPSTDAWAPTSTGANVPSPRVGHTAVWTGTEMIVWGGGTDTGGRYNLSTDSWLPTSTGANVPSPRRGHTAVWTGTEMIVWGGGSNTGGRYNPSTDAWTPTSTGANVPSPRGGHTAVWTGTEMIVWGADYSCDESGCWGHGFTGGRYNPSTDSWLPTSTGTNVPSAREWHTAVWTGAEMIVWGGDYFTFDRWGPSARTTNTGGRYDPSTDSWTPTSTDANVPSARRYHAAVWTGTEMIVWGGAGGANTGGRYNPSTDSWLPTSTGATAPSPRFFPTAVWTGTEMVIWGGGTNTGGRYNPSTDSWLPTSTGANVPSPRSWNTAVWTGTEMIIWGGYDSYSYVDVNTGGRYNSSTDSWTPTSTGANLPEARDFHTAVWTGTEMIVWGGYNANADVELNTGGRYNPFTDSWIPTSTGANVPPPGGYTAVWTGAEMIVWGGYGGGSSGGRYNPSTDSWLVTSTGANAPPPGSYTAVWTGAEMIVWGGSAYCGTDTTGDGYCTDRVMSGGRYCACGGGAVSTWYPDADGDGYGVDSTGVPSCSEPPGYVAYGGDCNDSVPGINPGAAEACNGVDDDCDGIVDNGGGALCDDGNVCTDDSCGGTAGCAHTNNSAPCDDGNACTTNDTCTVGVCAAVGPTSQSAVSAGWEHTCALRSDAALQCWGRNDYGQVSGPNASTESYTAVSVGNYHTCALRTDGRLACWGQDLSGQVSGPNGSADAYAAITAGALGTTCALRTDGRLACWGVNASGPNGSTATYTAVDAGQSHICALRIDGRLACWGFDGQGRVSGPNASTDRYVSVSAGTHTCAVRTDGWLACWGFDPNGQVSGPNASTDTYIAASAGANGNGGSTCALRSDGRLACWGFDGDGRVSGPNASTDRYASVSAGGLLNCAHRSDGRLVCWGSDAYGEVSGPNASTRFYGLDQLNCEDANICTDDSCEPTTGCVHASNIAPCDDGNACTLNDTCSGGACASESSVVCHPLDPCHAEGICDPMTGACSNPAQPDGTACDDGDLCTTGDACRSGSCTPSFSGLDEPNPRTNGYYKQLCHGPHSGDQLTDADAACVSRVTAAFAGISTVADICAVIEPSQPNNDPCGRAEDDLMVLVLNLCRARVCTAQNIVSQCGDNTSVGQSLAESDGILYSPSRDADTCGQAKCLDEEINTGRALELNSLVLNLDAVSVRLSWDPPYLNDGGVVPRTYHVWRRPQGSLQPFSKIGETMDPAFADEGSEAGAWQYEVTAVMR